MTTAVLGLLAILYLALGLTGLVFPRVTRRLIAVFVQRTPTRLLGTAMLVVGALVFRYNTNTPLPLLAKLLGFAIFVIGGAQLLIPDLVIVFNEWWGLQKLRWERAVSVAYVALAVFFLASASPAAYVESVSARLKPVYEEIAQSYSLLFPRKRPSPYPPGAPRSQEPESPDAQTTAP